MIQRTFNQYLFCTYQHQLTQLDHNKMLSSKQDIARYFLDKLKNHSNEQKTQFVILAAILCRYSNEFRRMDPQAMRAEFKTLAQREPAMLGFLQTLSPAATAEDCQRDLIALCTLVAHRDDKTHWYNQSYSLPRHLVQLCHALAPADVPTPYLQGNGAGDQDFWFALKHVANLDASNSSARPSSLLLNAVEYHLDLPSAPAPSARRDTTKTELPSGPSRYKSRVTLAQEPLPSAFSHLLAPAPQPAASMSEYQHKKEALKRDQQALADLKSTYREVSLQIERLKIQRLKKAAMVEGCKARLTIPINGINNDSPLTLAQLLLRPDTQITEALTCNTIGLNDCHVLLPNVGPLCIISTTNLFTYNKHTDKNITVVADRKMNPFNKQLDLAIPWTELYSLLTDTENALQAKLIATEDDIKKKKSDIKLTTTNLEQL